MPWPFDDGAPVMGENIDARALYARTGRTGSVTEVLAVSLAPQRLALFTPRDIGTNKRWQGVKLLESRSLARAPLLRPMC